MQSLTEPAAGAPAGGPAAAAGPGTEMDLVPVAEALAAALPAIDALASAQRDATLTH